ncbi:MAG: shikimate kinase [Clostridiaceae bacterium]|jgi:shikimate kinase|nr:shikimate kinase [Clostridiaceae bacterium]
MKTKTNIVLIGLMGSGKTTVGKKLASVLGMSFTDSDENIERSFGKISELFLKGEQHFRDIESKMVKCLSSLNNIIISTGGGVVLRPENMEALRKKGVVFYLKRPVEDIIESVDPADRPLIKDDPKALYRLFEEREPLYNKYCDYTIDATDIKNAIISIKSIWDKIS